jgi:hypothetical protein
MPLCAAKPTSLFPLVGLYPWLVAWASPTRLVCRYRCFPAWHDLQRVEGLAARNEVKGDNRQEARDSLRRARRLKSCQPFWLLFGRQKVTDKIKRDYL